MQDQFKIQSITDLHQIAQLDSTHLGATTLILAKHNNRLIVVKVPLSLRQSIKKSSIASQKQQQHIINQKKALKHFTSIQAKSINKLITTLQDNDNLYLVLQPVQGLALHKLIKTLGKLSASFTRIIISQIALILKSIHQQGYIYRDIKSSNFIIDRKGKVTLVDLGLAKQIKKERTYTICGTTHSMPPEIYKGEGYGYQFDYYSFGVLMYQLLVGRAPFGYGNSNPNIQEEKGLQEHHLNQIQDQSARDLIKKLMREKQNRLGNNNGFEQILQHQYFNNDQFMLGMDIYDGQAELPQQQQYEQYKQQIQQQGIDEQKYGQISEDDPFYKFYNIGAQ